MNHNACFIIPNYNHHEQIHDIVEALEPYRLPILIIDDGSDQPTREVLDELAATRSSIRLFRLKGNQGKGAAVMHGMLEAHAAGYTHALQIDADGQHDARDAGRLLKHSRELPDAVICGVPVYDDSIPKGRLYGRYITHFWVWLETLSLEIKDAMCGFRVYPLAPCVQLLQRTRLGKRMDFDIEILVRLFWRGVRIENIPTHVVYPKNGISHFRLLQDNLMISALHTRLFLGMLVRAPSLLLRRRKSERGHWSERPERGSVAGIRFLLMAYRRFGRTTFRLFLLPVIAYFYVTGREARRASRTYLHRVAETAARRRLPAIGTGAGSSFRHFLSFGDALLDKFAAWQGDIRDDDLDFPNRQEYLDLVNRKQGAILIGSHHGNLDMCRAYAMAVPGLKVNVLMFTEHAERFNRVLREVNPDLARDVILVSTIGVDTAILLKQKIEQGEYVVIVGDRTSALARERTQDAVFLGQRAGFAEGPFVLASLMQCPVYLLFCLKEDHRYRVYFERFADRLELPRERREEALRASIQRYADKLESLCIKAPLMWFNFFDFWKRPDSPAKE